MATVRVLAFRMNLPWG